MLKPVLSMLLLLSLVILGITLNTDTPSTANPATAEPTRHDRTSMMPLSTRDSSVDVLHRQLQQHRQLRNQRLLQLQDLPVEQLLETLQSAWQQRDDLTMQIGESLLLDRPAPESDIETRLGQLLYNPDLPQQHLIHLLARLGTPAAVQTLLEFIASEDDESSGRNAALQEIARMGLHRDVNGEFPTVLGAELRAQLARQPAPDVQDAILVGLGNIGDEASVTQLLRLAQQSQDTPLAPALKTALLKVRNPDGIKPLMATLSSSTELTPLSQLAGDSLANMGKVQATQALLDWAQSVSTTAARDQAILWLSQIRDPQSLALLQQAEAKFHFQDPQLLAQLQTVLAGQTNLQAASAMFP